jgi:hypothetical protein
VKKVRIESVEDIEALPEGEWVRVPAGIKADWIDDDFTVSGNGLEIQLPPAIAKQLRAEHGTRFRATLRGKRLIVKR